MNAPLPLGKVKVDSLLHGIIGSHEEWVRAKRDLVAIIYDTKSRDECVRDAFRLLLLMTDRERAYKAFPDVVKTLWKSHPVVAASVVPMLPERFVKKNEIPLVA